MSDIIPATCFGRLLEDRRDILTKEDLGVLERYSNYFSPLKGLDDFAGRIPKLASLKLTDCERNSLKGFSYAEDDEGAGTEELADSISLNRFRVYFGRAEAYDLSLHARLDCPPRTNPLAERAYGHCLGGLLNGGFLSTRENIESGKFDNAVLIEDRGLVVQATLRSSSTKVGGSLKPYWESYWFNILKPIVMTINGVSPSK